MKDWVKLTGNAGSWELFPWGNSSCPSVSPWPSQLCCVTLLLPPLSLPDSSAYSSCMWPQGDSQPPQIATGSCVSWHTIWERNLIGPACLCEPAHVNHRPSPSQWMGSSWVHSLSMIQSAVASAVRVPWEVRAASFRPVGRAVLLWQPYC